MKSPDHKKSALNAISAPAAFASSVSSDSSDSSDSYVSSESLDSEVSRHNRVGVHPKQGSGLCSLDDPQLQLLQRMQSGQDLAFVGPPGTGKTQILASLAMDFMARGKTLLIASNSDWALLRLRERLPHGFAPFSVHAGDLAPMTQTPAAPSGGEDRQSDVVPTSPQELTESLARARQALREVESKIHAGIESLTRSSPLVSTQTQAMGHRRGSGAQAGVSSVSTVSTPGGLARQVLRQQAQHAWIGIIEPVQGSAHQVSPQLLERLRQARLTLGDDLCAEHPSVNDKGVPSKNDLKRLHRELLVLLQKEEAFRQSRVHASAASGVSAFALNELADLFELAHRELIGASKDWVPSGLNRALMELFALEENAEQAHALWQLLAQAKEVLSARAELFDKVFEVPEIEPGKKARFWRMVEQLANGKNPLAWWRFPRTEDVRLISAIRINALKPVTTADWQSMLSYNEHVLLSTELQERWNALAPQFGLCRVKNPLDFRELLKDYKLCKRIGRSLENVRKIQCAMLAGHTFEPTHDWLDPDSWLAWGSHARQCAQLLQARNSLLEKDAMLAWAATQPEGLRQCLEETLITTLGHPGLNEEQVASEWLYCLRELQSYQRMHRAKADLQEAAAQIDRAGAHQWAQRLLSNPVPHAKSSTFDGHALSDGHDLQDPLTAPNWRQAWDWACAREVVENLSHSAQLNALQLERAQHMAHIQHLQQQLQHAQASLARQNTPAQAVLDALGAGAPGHAGYMAQTGTQDLAHRACWILPVRLVRELFSGSDNPVFDAIALVDFGTEDCADLLGLARQRILVCDTDQTLQRVCPELVAGAVTLGTQYASPANVVDWAAHLLGDYPTSATNPYTLRGARPHMGLGAKPCLHLHEVEDAAAPGAVARAVVQELLATMLAPSAAHLSAAVVLPPPALARAEGAAPDALQTEIRALLGDGFMRERCVSIACERELRGASFDVVLIVCAAAHAQDVAEQAWSPADMGRAMLMSTAELIVVSTRELGHMVPKLPAPAPKPTELQLELASALDSMGLAVVLQPLGPGQPPHLLVANAQVPRLIIRCLDASSDSMTTLPRAGALIEDASRALGAPSWITAEVDWLVQPQHCLDAIFKAMDLHK